jgi:hypothetical protein
VQLCSNERREDDSFDIDAEQDDVVETLAEVLSAARAIVESARPAADVSVPMSALRMRIGRLPEPGDGHAAHMACGSLLASKSVLST